MQLFLLLLLFLLFLGSSLAFLFLLALANDFGFRGLFAFNWRHNNFFFLDDADRRDHGVGCLEDFDSLAGRYVRDVQHLMNAKIRDVNFEHFRNLTRLRSEERRVGKECRYWWSS